MATKNRGANMKFELINKNIDATSTEDVLHIRGLANTGNTDVEGDTLSQEALLDICRQATEHNLHIDHDASIDGVLGPITRAELTPRGVEIDADILEGKYTSRIRDLLEHGVRLGMSVRGLAERSKARGGDFVRVVLTEISLTPLPADQSTLGSVVIVKSFGELAERIVAFNDDLEEDDNMADDITKDVVVELINTGFNERRDEFLEIVRNELKDEFGVVLAELKERVEKLESQLVDAPVVEEPASEEPVEEPQEEEEAVVVEEEVVLDDNDVVEEELVAEEPEAEAEAEEAPAEEAPEDEEEEEDEDDKKQKLEKSIKEIVDQKVEEIFKAHTSADLDFQYQNNEEEEGEEAEEIKKAFTPRELAELFS